MQNYFNENIYIFFNKINRIKIWHIDNIVVSLQKEINANKMSKTILSPKDEMNIVTDYMQNNLGIYPICEKYKIGKIKLKSILQKYDVKLNNKGKQPHKEVFKVSDWKIEKYPLIDGKHYIIFDPNTDFNSSDIENKGGILTSYIRKHYNVQIPTLYDRRLYYMRTGNYWWEQWLKVKLVENSETKKCPFCEWETIDLENKSGMFATHLLKVHNMTIEEYIQHFPSEISYFSKYARQLEHKNKLKDKHNYVVCPICGQKFEKLTESHMLTKHNISLAEFRHMYPDVEIMSSNMREQIINEQKSSNLVVSKNRFISSYEKEIQKFLDQYNVKYRANRQILEGKEIDILVPSEKIGIEFDGLRFHSEFFGKKSRSYHLDKTLLCNKHGYGLIHIFEDEYVHHKDIVLSKILHLLKLDNNKPRIYGRKCKIKHILKNEAMGFLNKFHIQGFNNASVYIGAFYQDECIAVMTFKYGNINTYGWELTRFATNYNYVCPGVGGKCLHFFIKEYNPTCIISFADRRWTVDIYNNFYTKLGFTLANIGVPDYSYYNVKIDKYKRFNKLGFAKQKLIKKYGFDEKMTELEMARELGYDRIWNCGLIKYVWKRKEEQ